MRTKSSFLRIRILFCFFLLFTLVVAPDFVWAQTEPLAGAPGTDQNSFLVIGIYRDGTLDPQLRDAAAQRILDAHLGVALQPSLSSEDLACRRSSCLERLAERFLNSSYIVGGALESDAIMQRSKGQIWIYKIQATEEEKRHQHRQMSYEIRCPDGCTPAQLKLMIQDDLEQLIRDKAPPKPSPQSRMRRACNQAWSFRRGFLLGASVGLAGSGLAAGIGVAGAYGFNANSLPTGGASFSALGFAGVGLGAIGVASASISSIWPEETLDRIADCLTNSAYWSPKRGIAAGLFSSALLASLASMITFATVPQTISSMTGTSIVGFSKQRNTSIGFAVTWAIGLGGSLLWPSAKRPIYALTMN